ncbi:hypothetical protein VPNG_08560 [Cytospora leucostoma]|uniref:Uncharacterized protein n=1 Tax=Cytospora leucostoma TaxID=1230097 RepID=A0A423W535_9PEZI|nr:hypothetical protein VPNG_08560 [Cytospora leucostoma]
MPYTDPPSPALVLPAGAKAGIAVAAGVLLLSVIGSAIWLFHRRRRVARMVPQPSSQTEMSHIELPDHRTDRHELEGHDARHELPSPKGISEISSGGPGGAGLDGQSPVGILLELE